MEVYLYTILIPVWMDVNGTFSPSADYDRSVYLKVLEEHLPTVIEGDLVFTHDNARIHIAKIITQWQWPAY